MDVSEWIKEKRHANLLTMEALGELAGLTHGAISRMESKEANPTVESIIKIVEALKSNEFLLFSAMNNGNIPAIHTKTGNYITYNDLNLFETYLNQSSEDGVKILSDLIEMTIKKKFNLKRDQSATPNISPATVSMLLLDHPMITASIDYPTDIPESAIYETLLENGMILPKDFISYVRQRIRTSIKDFPNDKERKIFYKNINMFPDEPVRRMNLKQLLEADKLFSINHEIFFMGWRAAQFELMTQYRPSQLFRVNPTKVWTNLILTSRWIASVSDDSSWIHEFRRKIQAKIPQ